MKQHTTPCGECPYRKVGGMPGYMAGSTPESYALLIVQDKDVPCHMKVDYEDKRWLEKWTKNRTGRYCAGSLVMAANLCKRSRHEDRPTLPADKQTVHPTLQALVEAHRAASVHSWEPSADAGTEVTEVRLMLRLPPLEIKR